ncbi:DNA recombination protein RmuC [Rhodococcus sp. X156]|uniref:DNA recombination protein RmuC n=1 Tax=Rhodococcus sp. X156 TaxID=2499145 RepID=UPI000FD9D097|nr:DNA recombination protein RmuC [Rhodococcus sp. X156]
MDLLTALALLVVLLIGAALGWFANAARSGARLAGAEAALEAGRANEEAVRRSISLLSEDSARRQSGAIGSEVAGVVGPLREAVGALAAHLDAVERSRLEAYSGLREQVAGMHRTSSLLSSQTNQLVTALRAPQVRGRWGELQLERVVELAGMVEHCDFATQVSTTLDGADGPVRLRPDMVVRLANDRNIVVDAKVPFAAYLDATEATDESEHRALLSRHARQLRTHVDQLSSKTYWKAFSPSPEFVVLFVPGDPFLEAALTADPELLEHAFARNIVIATPTTLIALLRTVAHTWRQESLSRDAAVIHQLGRELHGRLATVGGHLDKLGSQLGRAVDSFNATVSSMESRVLVTARRLNDLQVSTTEVPQPTQIDRLPRRVMAAELQDTASPERQEHTA